MNINILPVDVERKELIIDGVVAFLLAVIMGIFSSMLFAYLDSALFGLEGIDFWFQADLARVHFNMVNHEYFAHYRASVHPLFSLFGYYSTLLVHKIFGLSMDIHLVEAVRLVIAIIAALWLGSLYILLRLLSLQRFDAILFALIAAFSSASLFWFSVPETYSFGSLSILLALIVSALTQYRPVAEGWFVAASVATFSFTITNWMAGLAANFVNLSLWKAVRVTIISVVVVSLLWWIEKQIFPSTGSFLQNSDEANFFFREETGGPFRILLSFFSSSMVMPDVELIDKLNRTDWKILTVQNSWPWSGGFFGAVAVFCWIVLLCTGFWNLFWGSTFPRLRLIIGLVLAGQLALHLIYGEETFLYALHYLPLLVITASLGATCRFRKIVLVLAVLLLCSGGLNNILKFREARETMMNHFYPSRLEEKKHGMIFKKHTPLSVVRMEKMNHPAS